MKFRLAALLAVLITTASSVSAAVDPGRVTLRGSTGFSMLSLTQLNDDIRAKREAFLADTLIEDLRWDPFGGSPGFKIELEAQLTKVFSAGVGFSLQRGDVRHEAFRVFGIDPTSGDPTFFESFDSTPRFEAWDFVGTLGLWVPSAPGLHFGLQLGYVRGTYQTEDGHLAETPTELPIMKISNGTWRGSGAVLGLYTGYERPVTTDLSISTRIGYHYRRIGRLDGLFQTTTWGDQGNDREWDSGPLLDAAGKVMPLDLSGTYVEIGLSLGFGGGAE